MSNNKEYQIKRSTLVDIANAIREKTGKTDLIKVSDLDDAVKELSAGGGGDIGPKVHIVEELPTIEEAQLFDIYLIGNVDQERNYFEGAVYIVMSNYDTTDLQFSQIYDNRPS